MKPASIKRRVFFLGVRRHWLALGVAALALGIAAAAGAQQPPSDLEVPKFQPRAPASATSAAASASGAAAAADAGSADAGSADAATSADAAPQPADAGSGGKQATPDPAKPEAPGGTCSEHVPEGKARPKLTQRVAPKGLSGYAVTLEVDVEHGKGEKLFPSGFRLNRTSEEAAAFEKSGFAFPDPDGGAGPEIKSEPSGDLIKSQVRLNFVALPKKGGRQELWLPAVPITLARANGELVTLCTEPAKVTVDPPTANTPSPKPHPNPPPRPQREVWEAAKLVTGVALIALVVGAIVASLLLWLKRRPKPAPPPPPPRPPWEVAMEELHDLRQRQLIAQERFDEHYDDVCLILRRYLGNRYGIGEQLGDAGALESTTEEILSVLKRIVPPIPVMSSVESFLREADLVKFARATPDPEQCEAALAAVEQIVIRTVPGRPNPGQALPRQFPTSGVDAPIQDPALLAPPPGEAPLTESATAKLDGDDEQPEADSEPVEDTRDDAEAEPVDDAPESGRKS
ncbi:MAG: hypothetical protein R3B07_08555 [Polyangiaceae bacterium]